MVAIITIRLIIITVELILPKKRAKNSLKKGLPPTYRGQDITNRAKQSPDEPETLPLYMD